MTALSSWIELGTISEKSKTSRTYMIIIIIGALGAIKKGLETYLGRIPGQISISELQKITLLGTAHILRRVSYQAKNWLPFSASGPWFGLGPKDSQQTLSENGFIIIIIKNNIIIIIRTFPESFSP